MAHIDSTFPATMSAAVCHAPHDYRFQTIPTLPKRGLIDGEILVRVTRCGICAGDAKCYDGVPMFWGDDNGREPYVETPVVPGHEFTGIVVALGKGAGAKHAVEIGDSVVSEQVVACGACLYCRKGMRWLCVSSTTHLSLKIMSVCAKDSL
jgi:erythritol/L-threitol dehydrogenase